MSKKPRFSLAKYKDAKIMDIVAKTDKRILAFWAIDCYKRVKHFFNEEHPEDSRPEIAILSLQEWIRTGKFSMSVIRKASLDSHAAARETGKDDPARSAARSAGQAAATAHVKTHSIGAAIYALQAIHRAAEPGEVDAAVEKERVWQIRHLLELKKRGKEIFIV